MTKRNPNQRLTVNETVYYQVNEGDNPTDPVSFQTTYMKYLEDGEQVFTRKLFAEEEARKIDTGWVKKAICLTVKNIQSLKKDKNPSEEEKDELELHVLRVTLEVESKTGLLLSPGESLRIRPEDLETMFIQSLYGKTRYEIIVCSE